MVVSDMAPKFSNIPAHRVEYVPWTRDSEIAMLRRMTIGIMPLEDTLWTRGKCAFKMLCYMAAGVPVVVSPVGMNAEVLRLGELGIGAVRADDWMESLSLLLAEPDVAVRMGTRGREIAVANFSLRALAPRLATELKKAAGLSGDPMLTRGQPLCAV
jgi:glycosyltransferase involved in cell wall biosynthesis